jgi:hypothetical protein
VKYGISYDQKIVNELLLGDSSTPFKIKNQVAKVGKDVATLRNKSVAKFFRLDSPPSAVQNKFDLSWTYLPNSFMSGGTMSGRQWNPGEVLDLPSELRIHHANWTIGVDKKLAQMTAFRREFCRSGVHSIQFFQKKDHTKAFARSHTIGAAVQ